jgi:glycosyltransferase involved in cell wall biosynthesis
VSRPIAVAARDLGGEPRGVHRWLTEMTGAWRALGRDRDIALYVERDHDLALEPGDFEVRAIGPGPGGGATAWEQWTLARALRRDRPEVLLGPGNSLPLAVPTPAVVVLHDLSFEARPDWFSWREGARRRLLARRAARRARLALVVSEFTAREVERLYRLPRSRLQVVPNGVAARFRPLADPAPLEALRRRGLDGEVVLAVGSFFNRRHLPELLDAFAVVARRRPPARLVLVGDDRTHPRLDVAARLDRDGLAGRVNWLDRIDDDQLVALYNLARVTVYLSAYEGFGLPPIESLACGTPVIASATGALADNLAGHATLLVDHRPEAIAAAIEAVLDRPVRASTAADWHDRFSWARSAAAVLAALDLAKAS